jgi:hypothetical protein
MVCIKCKKKKKVINVANIRSVCENCFSTIIEKRVRKRIRLNKLFRKGDRILITDKLSLFLVKNIIKDLPVKLFFKKTDDINNKSIKKFIEKNKIKKLVVKWTLDDELYVYLRNIFFGERRKGPKQITVLKGLTDSEAIMFSKINKIQFKPNKKDKEIEGMFDRLEKKYPEIRYSLSKSILQLKK